jgi:mevalonate kinase
MDPLSWPLWLKLLAGWGPLGIWAGRAELQRGRVERAHHATRDNHAQVMQAINQAHEEAMQAARAEHQEQLRELTNRFVKLIEKQSVTALALASKVKEKTPNSDGGA